MLEVLSTAAPGTRAFRHTGVLDRTRVTVTYLLDVTEHVSRVACGLGSVTDEFLLAGLMTLPSDSLGPVDERFTKVLRTPSAARLAAVFDDPDGGTWGQRRISAPVDLLEIEIEATSWRRGCSAAHRWAGYGRRLVRTGSSIKPFELTEASHYGIGLVNLDGERTLDPSPFRPQRWTSARWRIAELVYGQFIALNS